MFQTFLSCLLFKLCPTLPPNPKWPYTLLFPDWPHAPSPTRGFLALLLGGVSHLKIECWSCTSRSAGDSVGPHLGRPPSSPPPFAAPIPGSGLLSSLCSFTELQPLGVQMEPLTLFLLHRHETTFWARWTCLSVTFR